MKALILGSSSGIGLATAELLIKNGWVVTGASKSVTDKIEFPQFLTDVRNPEEIAATLEKAGQIDAFIYCAGVGLASPVSETSRQDYMNLFDVNFFGLAESVKHALPHIPDGGKIVVISSMASVLPIPFNAFYSASKAAINAFATSLSAELKPRGITVTSVLPGGTKTGFSRKRKKYSSPDLDYSNPLERSINELTAEEQTGYAPEKVAHAILNVLDMAKPPLIMPVAAQDKAFCLLDRCLPKKLTNKIMENKFLH